MTLTIGSLFSGIGGLELGLERSGLGPVLWQCEIDPFCRSVLAKHWPNVIRVFRRNRMKRKALHPSFSAGIWCTRCGLTLRSGETCPTGFWMTKAQAKEWDAATFSSRLDLELKWSGDPRVHTRSPKEQCKATTRQGGDGYLCCTFDAGHPGKHRTSYVGEAACETDEWDEPPKPPKRRRRTTSATEKEGQ